MQRLCEVFYLCNFILCIHSTNIIEHLLAGGIILDSGDTAGNETDKTLLKDAVGTEEARC